MAAMLENAEFAPQPEVDRAASELLRRRGRRDLDFSLLDIALNVYVGQNHYEQ
jgi:hypothetical protein